MASLARMSVRLIELPLIDRLSAAHDRDPDASRRLVIVEVIDDRGRSGFGECSALNRAGYTAEHARGAFDWYVSTGGRVGTRYPMARAAREMAVLDWQLKGTGQPLVNWLYDPDPADPGPSDPASSHPGSCHPGSPDTGSSDTVPPVAVAPAKDVPVGPVLPLATIAATVAAATEYAEQGIRRVKLKVMPGHLLEPVAAVRRELPRIEIHVDGNASFGPDDLGTLLSLDEQGVSAIEQPFAIADRASAIALATRSTALVVADEAATDLATIEELVGVEAATAVSIKPPRLGGLRAALEVHDWCVANGVAATAGGMLESGLGRHALAAVAALPGFTLVGDLTPARRWLADDPFPDLAQVSGRILVPTDPGVAPPPDRARLDRYTIDLADFAWSP